MERLIITIIMTLATYAGSIYGMKYKGIFHKIISFGLATAIMLTWADIMELSTISLFMLIFLAILTTFYGIIVSDLYFTERVSISLIGFLVLAVTIFKIQHYVGLNILQLSLLLPVILYTYSLTKRMFTKELSFMLFWFLLAVIQLINLAQVHTIRL